MSIFLIEAAVLFEEYRKIHKKEYYIVDSIYVFIAVETVLIVVPAFHRLRDDRWGEGDTCRLRVGWSIWEVCTQHYAKSHMPTLQTVLTATGTNCFASVIVQSQKQLAIVFTIVICFPNLILSEVLILMSQSCSV